MSQNKHYIWYKYQSHFSSLIVVMTTLARFCGGRRNSINQIFSWFSVCKGQKPEHNISPLWITHQLIQRANFSKNPAKTWNLTEELHQCVLFFRLLPPTIMARKNLVQQWTQGLVLKLRNQQQEKDEWQETFFLNHVVLSMVNVVAFALQDEKPSRFGFGAVCVCACVCGGKLSVVIQARPDHLQSWSISRIFVLASI